MPYNSSEELPDSSSNRQMGAEVNGVLGPRQENRMSQKSISRKAGLWLVLALCALIVFLGIGNYLGILGNLHFKVGPFFSHHWMSWIGSAYIAVFVPIFHYLRIRNPRQYSTLLKYHVYGNLISVGLITVHFSQQLSRPPQAFPDLGTGLVLYFTMFLLVLTGIFLRFGFVRTKRSWWRYIHTGITTAFYLIIIIHALQGLEVL